MSEAHPPHIWEEPVRGSYPDPAMLGLDGLSRMRAAVKLKMPPPPIHHLTGLRPVEAGPGSSTFVMPASPWLMSPPGVFSAGVSAFLADAPLGTAISNALPAGKVPVTSDLTMNFLRPAGTWSETLIGRGRLVHAGRSLGLSEILVEDGRGKLLAHGTSRCFLSTPINPIPDPPETLHDYVFPEYPTPDPWRRPVAGGVVPQEVWDRMSGLDVTRGLEEGKFPTPPIALLTGARVFDVDEGTASFRLPATAWLTSPAVTIYGGALALLADLAMTVAVTTTVPPRTVDSPLDLKVNYLRPVFGDGRDLVARGTVTHRGRSMAVTSAEIENADGKRVAVATSSHVVLPDRAWSGEASLVPADDARSEEA